MTDQERNHVTDLLAAHDATSRVGSPRRATCQNELVTKPGFTNYESVRFFGGRAFASCERRWNTTSPLDQLRASATRLSLIERYLRSRSRLNRDPRDSSWLGVSRPAAIGSCPPPWPFRSTGSSLSIRTCACERPSEAAPTPRILPCRCAYPRDQLAVE